MAVIEVVHANLDSNRLSTLSEPALRKKPSSQPKQNRRTHVGKPLFTALAILLMASLSCNFVTGLVNGNGNTEISGPIIGMAAGSSVDQQGQVVDPQFTFDPSQPQIAVAVQVGKLDNPAPLTITWYQVTDQGNQKLFSDTVQVSANEQAYSIGTSPGLLAPGSYTVTATLNGQTEDTDFDVSPQKASLSGAVPASTQQGAPPVSGGSGTTPQSAATGFYKPAGPCTDIKPSGGGYSVSQEEDQQAEIGVRGECPEPESSGYLYTITVSATVNGALQKLGDYTPDPEGVLTSFYSNPCNLPGGSDLPGTKIMVTSALSLQADQPIATIPATFTLGDDDLAPRIKSPLQTSIPPGSKVKPGDKITITATAQEKRLGPAPWQTGVKDIQFTANGDVIDDPNNPWVNPSKLPQACDKKTWEHTAQLTYTVPKDASGLINLCAFAEDYNQAGSDTCATFHTGNHWIGTMRTMNSWTSSVGGCTNGQWLSNLDFYVAKDGTVTGTGTGHAVTQAQCHFPHQLPMGFATEIGFAINGTFDGKTFSLVPSETYTDSSTVSDLINYALLNVAGDMPPITFSVIGQGSAGGLVNISYTSRGAPGTVISAQHLIDITCEDCQP